MRVGNKRTVQLFNYHIGIILSAFVLKFIVTNRREISLVEVSYASLIVMLHSGVLEILPRRSLMMILMGLEMGLLIYAAHRQSLTLLESICLNEFYDIRSRVIKNEK